MTTAYEYGGPLLGSGDPTGTTTNRPQPWQRRHRRVVESLEATGASVSPELKQNIAVVTQECTEQLFEIRGEGREPIMRECNQWLDDTILAHMTFPDVMKVQGVNWFEVFLLPDADWLIDLMGWRYAPEVVEAIEMCMEIPECQIDYKKVAWELTKGFVREKIDRALWAIETSRKDEWGLRRPIWDVKLGWRLYNLMNEFKFATNDIWTDYRANKQGQEPLGASESYEPPREWEGYEEGNMPYNRRTGQWYPARRYGRGSYNRGYRYGNRRYGGGYSSRRRRTYRRW
tara:strand:+ start:126 stop:986 length:861 start_codon:yes stop_codon:yes gene_type:complete